jgi:phage tail-like protein
MPEFSSDFNRHDPYKNFRFQIFFTGDADNPVAGINKVSALKKTTQVIKHRSGGDMGVTRKSIGQTDYEAITLERGVTYDPTFEIWSNRVWNFPEAQATGGGEDFGTSDDATSGSAVALAGVATAGSDDAGFRRDIDIVMYNVSGQEVLRYTVHRCWPSEFTAMPELDATGNAVAIQTLVLQNEGWELVTDLSDQTPENEEYEDTEALPVENS